MFYLFKTLDIWRTCESGYRLLTVFMDSGNDTYRRV